MAHKATFMTGMTVLFCIVTASSGYIRVCYYTNWSYYRLSTAKFTPEDVDPFICTHVIFSFANLVDSELSPFEDIDTSIGNGPGLFAKIVGLKELNPSLKILLAVGGWNMGSEPFHAVVKSEQSQTHFVNTTIDFLRLHGFDGLDLDWEYPVGQKKEFVGLCKEFRTAFEEESIVRDRERLLLTAAVGAGEGTIQGSYDVPGMNKELDIITVMTYDLQGFWSGFTDFHTALYPRENQSHTQRELNVDSVMKSWVVKGADKSKLSVGIATYGRSWTLPSNNESSAVEIRTWVEGRAGPYTRARGTLAYYEICEMITNGAEVNFDAVAKVPYLKLGDQWVSYDNPLSIALKMKWLKENQYAGASVWALGFDDFSGLACGSGRYPLINILKQELRNNDDGVYTMYESTTQETTQQMTMGDVWRRTTSTPEKPQRKPAWGGFAGCSDLSDGFYEDGINCGAFHQCYRGTGYVFHCPGSLVFDATVNVCNFRYAVHRPECQ